jgi:tRNA(fMet)-specific endonuclease VapC
VAHLILDTTVLIAAERAGAAVDDLVGDDDDVAIAAVTAAELLVGVEMADAQHRQVRSALVEEVLAGVPIEDYDLEVARVHAWLLAHSLRRGTPRGAHDLIIAATAAARHREVVTVDPAGFADLPGVIIRRPSPRSP